MAQLRARPRGPPGGWPAWGLVGMGALLIFVVLSSQSMGGLLNKLQHQVGDAVGGLGGG